jgi:hypothetical protein
MFFPSYYHFHGVRIPKLCFLSCISISSHDSLSPTCFFTSTSIYLELVLSQNSQIHEPAFPSNLLQVRIPKSYMFLPSHSHILTVSLEYISNQNSLSPYTLSPRHVTPSLSLFLSYFLNSLSLQVVTFL